MSPEAFDGADKLMCVELLTPDGNWSSYPPHRHDDSPECPVNNEEIYYFRIGHAGTTDYAPDGFALHRTYTPDGDVDATVTIGDEDVFLDQARLPRSLRGRPRLPAVLPQRPRRSGWRAFDGVLRRPRPTTGCARAGTAWPPTPESR